MQGSGPRADLVKAEAEAACAWSDAFSTAPTPSETPSPVPLRMPLETPPGVLPGQQGAALTCQAPEARLAKQAQPGLQQTLEAHPLQQPALEKAYADMKPDVMALRNSEGLMLSASGPVCKSQVSVFTWP